MKEMRSDTRYSTDRIWLGSEATLVEYVIERFLLMRLPTVSRAPGVDPLRPPITGLISKRLRPKSLLVALCAGALMRASVSRLVAVPIPDCESTDALVSPDE